MEIESLLDCQERGSNARILGTAVSENPYGRAFSRPSSIGKDEWRLMRDAWEFGWLIEDTTRQNGTGIYPFLRAETTPAGMRRTRP